jgi:hypothetical protein
VLDEAVFPKRLEHLISRRTADCIFRRRQRI